MGCLGASEELKPLPVNRLGDLISILGASLAAEKSPTFPKSPTPLVFPPKRDDPNRGLASSLDGSFESFSASLAAA